METLQFRLQESIDSYSIGELLLPRKELADITTCLSPNCGGLLHVSNMDILLKMRTRPGIEANEGSFLQCNTCKSSITKCIEETLEKGFQRCFGRAKLTKNEVENLIWRGLDLKPKGCDEHLMDKWMLQLASIQLYVNLHDWKHHNSYFKNNRHQCRYKIPHLPCETTTVVPKYPVLLDADANVGTPCPTNQKTITHLSIHVKKRCPFIFLTDCNTSILSVLNCKNCTAYVDNQKVNMYYGAYTSKYNSENEMDTTRKTKRKQWLKLFERLMRMKSTFLIGRNKPKNWTRLTRSLAM